MRVLVIGFACLFYPTAFWIAAAYGYAAREQIMVALTYVGYALAALVLGFLVVSWARTSGDNILRALRRELLLSRAGAKEAERLKREAEAADRRRMRSARR